MKRPADPARPDIHTRITQQIISQLEAGVRPWTQPWKTKTSVSRPLRHDGTPYNGINVVLLWGEATSRGFSRSTWMTFRQALAVGAHVRKGEHGATVVYANQIELAEQDPERLSQPVLGVGQRQGLRGGRRNRQDRHGAIKREGDGLAHHLKIESRFWRHAVTRRRDKARQQLRGVMPCGDEEADFRRSRRRRFISTAPQEGVGFSLERPGTVAGPEARDRPTARILGPIVVLEHQPEPR